MDKDLLAIKFLRIALAFSFLYAAISGFMNPDSWIGFFPLWMRDLAPFSDELLLHIFSSVEIILGAFLIFQKKPFYAGVVSAAMLLGIVVFNLRAMDIVFRDVGLFFGALALVALSRKSTTPTDPPHSS